MNLAAESHSQGSLGEDLSLPGCDAVLLVSDSLCTLIVAAMGEPTASQSVTLPLELSMKLRYEDIKA